MLREELYRSHASIVLAYNGFADLIGASVISKNLQTLLFSILIVAHF